MDATTTIVIPTYQCAPWLPRAVESVLEQTRDDFELAIVDDGSTDGTSEVAARFLGDPRVRYLRHEARRGPSAARNTGIRATSAPLVTFLDADDYWAPEYLEVQTATFEAGEADVSCVAAWVEWPEGREKVEKSAPLGGDALYEELLFTNTIPASSSGTMVRRGCLERVGRFDESMFASEDRDLWVRLAANCRYRFHSDPLATVVRGERESAVYDHLRMAEGHESFLRNREGDIPARFRHLLPRLRSHTYLKLARLYEKGAKRGAARRYAFRAALANARRPGDLRRALGIVARSMMPGSLRRT